MFSCHKSYVHFVNTEKVELEGNEVVESAPKKANETKAAAPRKIRNMQQRRVEEYVVPRRSKNATSARKQPPQKKQKTQVTPSPKPTPAAISQSQTFVGTKADSASTTKWPHGITPQTQVPLHPHPQAFNSEPRASMAATAYSPQTQLPPHPHPQAFDAEPRASTRTAAAARPNGVVREAGVKRSADQAHSDSSQNDLRTRVFPSTQPHQGRHAGWTESGHQSSTRSRSQPPSRSSLSPMSNLSPKPTATWRQDKRAQTRSQQKAFRRKADNPFRNFSFDPNDAESTLDFLSSQSQPMTENSPQKGSIIPAEGLRLLDAAYKTVRKPSATAQARGSGMYPPSRMNPRGRRALAVSGRPTASEILALKAQECNEIAAVWNTQPQNQRPYYPEPASHVDYYQHQSSTAPVGGSYYGNATQASMAVLGNTSSRYFNAHQENYGTQPDHCQYSNDVGYEEETYQQPYYDDMASQSFQQPYDDGYGMAPGGVGDNAFHDDVAARDEMSVMTQSWAPGDHYQNAQIPPSQAGDTQRDVEPDGLDDGEMSAFFF